MSMGYRMVKGIHWLRFTPASPFPMSSQVILASQLVWTGGVPHPALASAPDLEAIRKMLVSWCIPHDGMISRASK